MKQTLKVSWLWVRRSFAASVLFAVTWASLTDADGLRAHEVTHLLANIYRMTGLPMDKIVHFLMYFGVCGALWMAFPARVKNIPSPWAACILATLWGALMECLQWLETRLGWGQRGFDILDMLANLCGALTATGCILLALLLWQQLIRRRA